MVSMPSPGSHHIVGQAEADGIAQKMPHRTPRRVDRRFAVAEKSRLGCEPGAVRTGDRTIEIGDRGDHRWPGLGRVLSTGR